MKESDTKMNTGVELCYLLFLHVGILAPVPSAPSRSVSVPVVAAARAAPTAQAPATPGTPNIPQSAVRAATAEANSLAGTTVEITFDSWDTSKVLVVPNQPDEGVMVKKLAGTSPIGAIALNPKELERVVPGCTAPGNEAILKDLLVLILAHEFEHLEPSCGGHGSGGSTVSGSPPVEIPSCDHLRQYKNDGSRTCARILAIKTSSQSLEVKCKRAAALCKYHSWLKEKNTSGNGAIATSCNPAVPLPIVSDCPDCPTAGFECPQHHTVY